ncbi:MAG TPA: chemotaxis protein CheB [Gemmatimonadaceae bacterium]|nr:chemotaxis protein CheB [Gemmatimonadaceae bacterium]
MGKRSAKAPTPADERHAPPIVGVGASAGGLDAFLRFVRRLPADSGLAYVLVQHLSPEHESHLPDLLGRAAAIPVVQAHDGERIEANHAYVIPPNASLTVTDGHLRLAPRRKKRGPHLPIDAFLCSLAEVHGPGAVGVILSGAGSDGARGIRAIKEAGGITLAQDHASAQHGSMPAAAVATGCVDFVLAPEEIADQLARLGHHLARQARKVSVEEDSGDGDEAVHKVLALLHRRTGVDFEHYRRGTVQRRILRRMLVHNIETGGEYVAHLRVNPIEIDLLFEDLLIGVTSFFRDREVFDVLRDSGFPRIVEAHAPGTPIRVWVAGCAGGEEAYSLTIALLEYARERGVEYSIQVFGTDLSDVAITRARAGIYAESLVADVSPELLDRYFVKEEGGYRITKAVRDLCVFSRQNVVRDPPFSHLDLISCRNVLIYLEPTLQRRVFPIFHYALEPHGLLMLGTAESPGAESKLFEPLHKRHRIYRRRAVPSHAIDVDFTAPLTMPTLREGGAAAAASRRAVSFGNVPPSPDDVGRGADGIVLARLSPPGVVVNERFEIVQFRGDTSGLFAHAPGTASLDVLRLARPELVLPLRAALGRAAATDQPAREVDIALGEAGATRVATIDVLPFRPASSASRYFVLMFTDVPRPPAGNGDGRRSRVRKASTTEAHELRRVRDELAAARRYLQDIIEQHQGTTEELRAASEEIQASNEELQSTNEELETTKEEVQSANEELTTVNEELRHRNRELAALSADLSNVLASTTIPIAIIGSDRRLRRFTPALERVMRVISTDAGRPLADVRLRFDGGDLEQLITLAVETLAVSDRDVQDEEGRWWSLTVRPYQGVDRRVDGAVLVFSDIDASKRAEERAEHDAEMRREMLAVSEDARTLAEGAQRVAEEANRAKATFLANMSHDLRTPLNAIGGYADLLELGVRGPLTESQRIDLLRIKRSARNLLVLLTDILNYAKLEAGHIELTTREVELESLVASLDELVGVQCAAKSIRLEHADVAGTARADADRLQQILLNLMSNAIKFTGRGGTITVASEAVGDRAYVSVSDTGCGIPADELDRIFEPFVQVGRSLTSTPSDGIGLGLAISRELARAMHGDLTVRSAVGVGTKFTVDLPRGTATR